MDGELGSSRYGPADRGSGRGRHNRHHNRRGGRGRGGRGGRHNRRHQPYHNNNNRRRGPRPPGNRFANDTTTVDPETAMQRQLAAMVSRVGELKDPEPQMENTPSEEGTQESRQRPVMEAISKNIQDLSAVLCSEGNAALFLKFENLEGPLLATTGPLAALLVNCVTTLPLQTPTYVGLTLAVDKRASDGEYSGFAQRCIHYAMKVVSQQVDQILSGDKEFSKSTAVSQVKHLLRYLALLTRVDKVKLLSSENGNQSDDDSFFGLLKTFAHVAIKASDRIVAKLFKHWVLSTLPYLPNDNIEINNAIKEELWIPLVDLSYESNFAPGVGCYALLLKTAQHEEGIKDEGDDDEEEDEEDDDEDAEQICDTLQDLIRCFKPIITEQSEASTTKTRFALFKDSPWEGLLIDGEPSNEVMQLALPNLSSKYIPMILTGDDCCPYGYHHNLESAFLFGRLPIFGSPAADDNDDNDDDDDEMEETPTNAQLQAYEKEFSLLDRLMIADAVRECLLNHETIVTDTGVSRGEAKDTAQQVWSICHVVLKSEKVATGEPGAPPVGIEYILVETLLSLILQASSDSFLRPLYLSRVLLELVRSQPAVMPQALAVGVSNLFQFYLPTLVPSARDNFSRWFAFHLTNTDYQWPKAYWDHWASYVVDNQNSRGDFVRFSLEIMAENLSSMETMVTTCLPSGSVLVNKIRQRSVNGQNVEDFLLSLEKDTRERVWDRNEDPDSILDYITGEEVAETLSAIPDKSSIVWCRTRAIIRSLMQNVEKYIQTEEKQLSDAVAGKSDSSKMEEENNASSTSREDVLAVTTDAIIRYQNLIIRSLDKDLENSGVKLEDDKEIEIVKGRASLLENVLHSVQNSRVFMEGCLICLLDNDIVNTRSVIAWLLDQDNDTKVGRWWDYAILSFRVELNKVLQSSGASMVVDRDGETDGDTSETMTRVKSIDEFAAPLFKLTTEKVLTRLSNINEGHHKGLSPVEVDLIEGLKLFVMTATVIVLEALIETEERSTKLKTKMAMKHVNEYSGPALAGICREHSPQTKGITTLISVLEAMH